MRACVRAAVLAWLAFFFAVTGASALIHRTGCSATFSTINVANLTAGTQPVNGLQSHCYTNPADTVAANTNWTTASTKYLSAPAQGNYVATFLPFNRDVEVTTWTRLGIVYLRLDSSGNAIYFSLSGNSTNGTLEIGIVTGENGTTYQSGTYYAMYSNTDLVDTIGYKKTATDGDTFTFGVSGFTIYAKYNGVQFASFQDYRQMSAGQVGFKSVSGNGFRSITTTVLTPASLFSNYSANILDMRDFGLRSIQTTGSIASAGALTCGFPTGVTFTSAANATFTGSISGTTLTVSSVTGAIAANQGLSGTNVLANTVITGGSGTTWTVSQPQTVASTSMCSGSSSLVIPTSLTFQVNDYVVVETGGEAGGGARGTAGIGGQWPFCGATSTQVPCYATTATLLADTSQPANSYAWPADTGLTYQWQTDNIANVSCSGANVTLTLTDPVGTGAGEGFTVHVSGITGGTNPPNGNFTATAGTIGTTIKYTAGASCTGPFTGGTESNWTKAAANIVSGSYTSATGAVHYTLDSPLPMVSTNICHVYFTGSNILDGSITLTAGSGNLTVNATRPLGLGDVSTSTGEIDCNGHTYQGAGFYVDQAGPLSLIARITAISGDGKTLTLDTAAPTTTTGANVYLDNTLIVNNITQTARGPAANFNNITPSTSCVGCPATISFPAGDFWFSGNTIVNNHPGWIVAGVGQASTFLRSPKSVMGVRLFFQDTVGQQQVHDLSVSGNAGDNGYGINIGNSVVPIPVSALLTEYDWTGKILTALASNQNSIGQTTANIGGSFVLGGVEFLQGGDQLANNVTINNVFNDALACENSDHCRGTNITANSTYNQRSYTQWQLIFNTQTNNNGPSGCDHCTVNATFGVVAGISMDASLGVHFTNITTTNAAMECNNCGQFLWDTISITLDTSGILAQAWTPGNSMAVVDTNNGTITATGGSISNMSLTQIGPLDVLNDVEEGVKIAGSYPSPVSITGLTYDVPNYTAPSIILAPTALISPGSLSVVTASNITGCAVTNPAGISINNAGIAVGNGSVSHSNAYNIFVTSGSVINSNGVSAITCTGACTPSGNTTGGSCP